MKIECLKPGTDITIDASDGTKNLSFASSVLEVTDNDREYLKQVCPRSFNLSQIPIAVVYEQEYVVNFESKTAVFRDRADRWTSIHLGSCENYHYQPSGFRELLHGVQYR